MGFHPYLLAALRQSFTVWCFGIQYVEDCTKADAEDWVSTGVPKTVPRPMPNAFGRLWEIDGRDMFMKTLVNMYGPQHCIQVENIVGI
jgi:hypothetical protein